MENKQSWEEKFNNKFKYYSNTADIMLFISQVAQSEYERGRKEGVEDGYADCLGAVSGGKIGRTQTISKIKEKIK